MGRLFARSSKPVEPVAFHRLEANDSLPSIFRTDGACVLGSTCTIPCSSQRQPMARARFGTEWTNITAFK